MRHDRNPTWWGSAKTGPLAFHRPLRAHRYGPISYTLALTLMVCIWAIKATVWAVILFCIWTVRLATMLVDRRNSTGRHQHETNRHAA